MQPTVALGSVLCSTDRQSLHVKDATVGCLQALLLAQRGSSSN
jgi:hypothetical protein